MILTQENPYQLHQLQHSHNVYLNQQAFYVFHRIFEHNAQRPYLVYLLIVQETIQQMMLVYQHLRA